MKESDAAKRPALLWSEAVLLPALMRRVRTSFAKADDAAARLAARQTAAQTAEAAPIDARVGAGASGETRASAAQAANTPHGAAGGKPDSAPVIAPAQIDPPQGGYRQNVGNAAQASARSGSMAGRSVLRAAGVPEGQYAQSQRDVRGRPVRKEPT